MSEDYICYACDGTGGNCVDGECWECNGTGYIDPPWSKEGFDDEGRGDDMSKEYIHVELIGDHPHAGERGVITAVDGKVLLIAPLGLGKADMVLVTLDNCAHGETGCYATRPQMRRVQP